MSFEHQFGIPYYKILGFFVESLKILFVKFFTFLNKTDTVPENE